MQADARRLHHNARADIERETCHRYDALFKALEGAPVDALLDLSRLARDIHDTISREKNKVRREPWRHP